MLRGLQTCEVTFHSHFGKGGAEQPGRFTTGPFLGCRNGVTGLQNQTASCSRAFLQPVFLIGFLLFYLDGWKKLDDSSCTSYSIQTPWEALDVGEESKREGLTKWRVRASDKFADATELGGADGLSGTCHVIHRACTAAGFGPCEPHEVQQGQVQGDAQCYFQHHLSQLLSNASEINSLGRLYFTLLSHWTRREKCLMDQKPGIGVSLSQEWAVPTRVQNISYLLPLLQHNLTFPCFYIAASAGGLEALSAQCCL